MKARSSRRTAFTLIEILVVIVIVATLIAILIPAVMWSRETARRVQCQNNLKSIALAINAHLDQRNYYPREENGFSAFVIMLPFLDQSPLFNSFNLVIPRPFSHGPPSSDINYTASSTTLSVFVCPSEIVSNTSYGPCSYGGNLGWGVGRISRPDNGPFASSLGAPEIRDALVRDGLANTVAVSEFCRTQGRATRRDVHAVFRLGSYGRDQFDAMISDCSAINIEQHAINPIFRGQCWAFDGLYNTLYDHNFVPNHHTCACNGGIITGVWTASSYHPNGVDCAHLDGHVSFVRDTISLPAWRALGTMAGGEIISSLTD